MNKNKIECTKDQNGYYQKGEYRMCNCELCEKELIEHEKAASMERLDFRGIFASKKQWTLKNKTTVFYSCAIWPNGQFTEDKHYSKEDALSVIRMLERDGYGGFGVTFPVETYVKEIEE